MTNFDHCDIILRSRGYGEWIPIINSPRGNELYRGDVFHSPEDALARAKQIFEEDGTAYIREFKQGKID